MIDLSDVSHIMLVGDIHGDLNALRSRVIEASKLEIPIFQLGDFGYWRHMSNGEKFHANVIKMLDEYEVDLFFIRGNHEYMINSGIPKGKGTPGLLDLEPNCGEAFHQFEGSERFHYIIDGIPWQIGSKTFIGIGGAYSIDEMFRTKYVSWWPEEDVSIEIAANLQSTKVDYLLSHETIEDSYIYEILNPLHIEKSTVSRNTLREIVNTVQPNKIFHGHWHQFYRINLPLNYGNVEIVGLADGASRRELNRIILHVETGEWGIDV